MLAMKLKHLLSMADLTPERVWQYIDTAVAMKRNGHGTPLAGKSLALVFQKPSNRTRVSFEVGMHQLGGHATYLSQEEIGLGVREPIADVARTLSRYVDGIVARTYAHKDLEELAAYASVPVINGLSEAEHPCQALADLLTIREKKGALRGVVITYVGDGNNVAASLALAATQVGADFRMASPEGYWLATGVWAQAQDYARVSGSHLLCVEEPEEVVRGADVVYTDVWTSMGQEAEAEVRRKALAPYQVTARLLAEAKEGVLFMHPLPVHHGEEVERGLLEHPASVVFDQAENRLHIQKAILADLLGGARR